MRRQLRARRSEWAEWQTIAATYRIDVWFCDPHSPWQRGQIENHNRQARWWFPRGTRLDTITPAAADHVGISPVATSVALTEVT